MNERDFQLILRAKRQIDREAAMRSFFFVGICFVAVLRLVGLEVSFLYPLLFIVLFVSLVLNSDFIANFGLVSKRDLVKLIERHIHNDPDTLTRYSELKSRI
ncbi:MAG: hypothetical protein RL839_12535 [Gammaproteobacteria bacterium]